MIIIDDNLIKIEQAVRIRTHIYEADQHLRNFLLNGNKMDKNIF